MQLSARNQLKGKVKSINTNDVSAEVLIDVNGQELCSTITAGSVKSLDLKEGDNVTAIIKASSVMLMK
ncbi:MAG: TOBE domain-containing protein [Clostridia bacterium]|nr:TOBE domain-containing protein [Clostridia bacterium]